MKLEEKRFFKDYVNTIANMYRLGWDERNGGNVTCLIPENEIAECIDVKQIKRTFKIEFDVTPLIGKYFLVTGTGKYFKNVQGRPNENIGIIKVLTFNELGLIWGLENDSAPTSELPSHFMSHITRLKANANQRVIIHCHPTNLVAMTYIHKLDERAFTRTLWKMSTECIVVFPDGIGVLPWMLCGNGEIGVATAEKMHNLRLVVWAQHGIFAAGSDLDEAFGLIETVEKAAEIYLKVCDKKIIQTIEDQDLALLAHKFEVTPKKGYL